MYKCKYRQLQRLARQVEVGKLSLDTEPDLIAWYEARRACLHNPVTFFPLLIFRFAICFIAVSLLGCAVTWLARLPDLADGETPAKSILKVCILAGNWRFSELLTYACFNERPFKQPRSRAVQRRSAQLVISSIPFRNCCLQSSPWEFAVFPSNDLVPW
eukprot:CAMPEP_0175091240 /NCGR_PEP_ID=MMETSP0086_2-20121207/1793_1 /TAXON_ID=136419 /ORGANISM="Unknown Unknown, Strain D1" /LENGTH=158 /DNA_ID=CAMNT_0016363961 /DNA_START=579 /DNA_END=1052 /DNA_ORIENTATION=+